MLQYLNVKNLALMEAQALEMDAGFIAITGETGAGKSVLLGALRLLSGARVDKTIIRQGEDTCEVEASIHLPHPAKVDAVLEQLGLPLCEDNALLLRRTLSRTKSPRIHINGALTTLTILQRLGELWIDFHGPGEPQKLFHEKYQLSMLDFYANLDPLKEQYQAHYTAWQKILKEIAALKSQEHLNDDEIQFLQAQIEKIEQVNPSQESIEKLEQDFSLISNSQEVLDLASKIESTLNGDNGASVLLSHLTKASQRLSDITPEKGALLADRLQSLIIECEDLADEYASLSESINLDEENIASIQERMDLWFEIKRKYGPDLDSVLSKHQALVKRITSQSDIEGTLTKLKEEARHENLKAETIAQDLSQKRQEAGKKLAPKVMALLKKLGFKHAHIAIDITKREHLSDSGFDHCTFLFAPNAGQEMLPLNKIASSGETARVMLALKAILAEADNTPVLVFDEVDANVGGEIGLEVGECLAKLGKKHQVLCVTHLPQVAAQATSHFIVNKSQTKSNTRVSINAIHNEQDKRLKELARMLGNRDAESALKHAEVLMGS